MTPETAVADRLWGRVASPDLLRGRTDRRPVRLDPGGLPSPAWLFGAAESCRNRFGARRLGEHSRDCARSPRP